MQFQSATNLEHVLEVVVKASQLVLLTDPNGLSCSSLFPTTPILMQVRPAQWRMEVTVAVLWTRSTVWSKRPKVSLMQRLSIFFFFFKLRFGNLRWRNVVGLTHPTSLLHNLPMRWVANCFGVQLLDFFVRFLFRILNKPFHHNEQPTTVIAGCLPDRPRQPHAPTTGWPPPSTNLNHYA